MWISGLTQDQLETYRPAPPDAPDFDEFWAETLRDHTSATPSVHMTPWSGPLTTIDVQDVVIGGYDGDPIRGWYLRPVGDSSDLPCVVMFEGYGGGRGLPHEWLFWPSAGYAVLVMDTRGQGSGHRRGDTADPHGSGSQAPGFMTRGIQSRDDYYYRRVFTDAVSFVRAAPTLKGVDSDRIVVAGGSQGGGIALAAAGLVPIIRAAMPDVPFLCHIARACEITDAFPYQEIVQWCRVHRHEWTAAMNTLAYFDGINFARRASAPALISVGMHDPICPPETVYAAANHYGGPVTMTVWPYSAHEGGGVDNLLVQAAWLAEVIA